MAEQNKKADGTQFANGDVTSVSPLNVGRGILWNPETKQYYVAIDDRTFEVDELGRLKLRVSALEDNQMTIRNDGVYFGKTPEQSSFYVDYLNGSDDNNGTKESPLKTIISACKKVKHGTIGTTIFLKEGQTHTIAQNGYITVSASVEFRPYGDILESLELRWDTPRTGWHVLAAKEYYPHRPIINVIPSWQIAPMKGTNAYSPTWLYVDQQNEISFSGIKFQVSHGSKTANPAAYAGWNSLFMGKGLFEFIDCAVLNTNNNGKWVLVDDHDGLITAQYRKTFLESTDPKDAITSITKKMIVEIEGEDTERSHPSGLTWMATTRNADVKASVRGANNITPTSSNYVTNI